MRVAQSSHLQSYDYDQNTQTLSIEFQNGAVYQYPGVSFEDYNRLVQAGGAGTTFWAFIRAKYSAAKITPGRRSQTQGEK
jgi:hypothetical protein